MLFPPPAEGMFVKAQLCPLMVGIRKGLLLSVNYVFNCYYKKNIAYWVNCAEFETKYPFYFSRNVDANQMCPHGFN